MFSRQATFPLVGLVLLLGCTSENPEAQVKRAFVRCVQDLEAGDGRAALEVLGPAFEGPEGLDRDGARLYLLGLLQQGRIGITVVQSRIEAGEQEAFQEVDVLLTRRGGRTLLPDETSRQSFQIRWERRKGAWKVKSLQNRS